MTREDSMTDTRMVRVGNYRFTGKILGKGSFATVEEAVHIRLKVKVSVKNINLLKCNSYVIKHLTREASVLHKLNHPNILRLFETMKYGNHYCIVAEILRGGDLCTYVQQQRRKQLDESTTRRLSRQITSALGYLHGKGIVHRDLKLENIMLDSRKENIKLVDFGLSNSWRVDCPLKTLCGSPEYSAPELFITGTQYGPEVDMWALGVIMFAMAVGRLPFPCVSSIMKEPEKRSKFMITIRLGLSREHTNFIVGYSPEFIALLKGLMNPQSNMRLTVKEALADPWMSNQNRWDAAQYDSLDAFEIGKIALKVCDMLDITEDSLRAELQNRPCGDVAGIYNIMIHEHSQPKKEDTLNGVARTSTKSRPLIETFYKKYGQEYNKCNKVSSNKIWVVGVAHKLNEVVKGRKTLQRSIYTCNTPSSQQSSKRSSDCNTSCTGDIKMAAGDSVSIPRIGPFKALKTDAPYDVCKTDSAELLTSQHTFKEKNKRLHQPILPSKLLLRSPKCKVMADVHKCNSKA